MKLFLVVVAVVAIALTVIHSVAESAADSLRGKLEQHRERMQ